MLLLITQLHRLFASEAKAMVKHAVPLPESASLDTPYDLRDRRMSRNLDRFGVRTTGLLSPNDIGNGCDPVGQAMQAFLPVTIAIAGMYGSGIAGAIAMFLLWAITNDGQQSSDGQASPPSLLRTIWLVLGLIFCALMPQALFVVGVLTAFVATGKYLAERQAEREKISQQDALFAADSASLYSPLMDEAIGARNNQNQVAIADKTPLLVFAYALGYLIKKGDIYAPDAFLWMAASVRDLSTHLVVFGRTGSGKTACVMRPMFDQWIEQSCGGALVLDGKGSLPTEFHAKYPDRIKLIAPGKAKFNPISGLTPEEVTIVLVETMNEGGENDFWSRSAEQVIRNAGIVLEAAGKAAPNDGRFKWKLTSLSSVVANKKMQEAAIQAAKDLPEASRPGLLRAAIADLEIEFAALAEETRSGIVKTAMSFIAPIVGHRDLYEWCDTDEGDVIENVCHGEIFAVSTPASRYGNPGIAIQALSKARVYRAIKARADYDWEKAGETRALVIMDEFQKMCGSAEANMLDIGRSLGLVAVAATQSLEAVDAAMGKADSRAMLANFVNCICFNTTKETLTYVAEEKMGYGILRKEAEMRGIDFLKMGEIADTGYSGRAEFVPSKNLTSGEYTLLAQQIMTPEELGAAVAQRFHAAVYLERGGAPRRDIGAFQPGGYLEAQ